MNKRVKKLTALMSAFVAFVLLTDTSTYGLGIIPAAQRAHLKNEMLGMLDDRQSTVRYAHDPSEKKILSGTDGMRCAILSSGQYLVDASLKGDYKKSLYAILYAENYALMRILSSGLLNDNDPFRYAAIKDLMLREFPANRKNVRQYCPYNRVSQFSQESYVYHLYAQAIAWIQLEDDKIVSDSDIPAAMSGLVAYVRRITSLHRSYFEDDQTHFLNHDKRRTAISIAAGRGMRFYGQAMPASDVKKRSAAGSGGVQGEGTAFFGANLQHARLASALADPSKYYDVVTIAVTKASAPYMMGVLDEGRGAVIPKNSRIVMVQAGDDRLARVLDDHKEKNSGCPLIVVYVIDQNISGTLSSLERIFREIHYARPESSQVNGAVILDAGMGKRLYPLTAANGYGDKGLTKTINGEYYIYQTLRQIMQFYKSDARGFLVSQIDKIVSISRPLPDRSTGDIELFGSSLAAEDPEAVKYGKIVTGPGDSLDSLLKRGSDEEKRHLEGLREIQVNNLNIFRINAAGVDALVKNTALMTGFAEGVLDVDQNLFKRADRYNGVRFGYVDCGSDVLLRHVGELSEFRSAVEELFHNSMLRAVTGVELAANGALIGSNIKLGHDVMVESGAAILGSGCISGTSRIERGAIVIDPLVKHIEAGPDSMAVSLEESGLSIVTVGSGEVLCDVRIKRSGKSQKIRISMDVNMDHKAKWQEPLFDGCSLEYISRNIDRDAVSKFNARLKRNSNPAWNNEHPAYVFLRMPRGRFTVGEFTRGVNMTYDAVVRSFGILEKLGLVALYRDRSGRIAEIEKFTQPDIDPQIAKALGFYRTKKDMPRIRNMLSNLLYHDLVERITGPSGKDIVLIGSPSKTGKTTLSLSLGARIRSLTGKKCVILRLDRYFKVKSERPSKPDGSPDPDNPGSLHMDWLREDIEALLRGETVDLPFYTDTRENPNGVSKRRSGENVRFGKGDILIVESIFALQDEVVSLFGRENCLKVFIDAPEPIRVLKKILHEERKGGARAIDILRARPAISDAEKRFVYPKKSSADVLAGSFIPGQLAHLAPELNVYLDEALEEASCTGETGVITFIQKLKEMLEDELVKNRESHTFSDVLIKEFSRFRSGYDEVKRSFFKHWGLFKTMYRSGSDARRILDVLAELNAKETWGTTGNKDVLNDFWGFILKSVISDPDFFSYLENYARRRNPLYKLCKTRLTDGDFVAIFHNQPFIHRYKDGAIRSDSMLSGAVPHVIHDLLCNMGYGIDPERLTWVAIGYGDADFDTGVVDGNNEYAVKGTDGEYRVKRVKLDKERNLLYRDFCNDILWPYFHTTEGTEREFSAYVDRRAYRGWAAYQGSNRVLAEGAIEKLKRSPDPILQVHDYQSILTGKYVRQAVPEVTSLFFLHVPFPEWKYLSSMEPEVRRGILEGLLAYDTVSFHTDGYRENFAECLRNEFGGSLTIDRGYTVSFNGRRTYLKTDPIGIDSDKVMMDSSFPSDEVEESIRHIKAAINDRKDRALCLSVERSDYIKGAMNRLKSIEALLDSRPELAGKIIFAQVLVEVRQESPAFKRLNRDIHEMTARINDKFRDRFGYDPVYTIHGIKFPELMALEKRADIFWVNSLIDGLALVGKEFVVTQSLKTDPGILVLSKFAGASDELGGAVSVDPFDVPGTARKLYEAYTMPREEKKRIMDGLYGQVSRNDAYEYAYALMNNMVGAQNGSAPGAGTLTDYDTECLEALLCDHLYGKIDAGRTYTVRYDVSRLSQEQAKIIEAYISVLEQKFGITVERMTHSRQHGSKESLIAVYSRGNGPGGEGHVDIKVPDDAVESDYFLRITGMLNIAFVAANIPEDAGRDNDLQNKYGHLVHYIADQYKAILGTDMALDGPADGLLRALKNIVLVIPGAYKIPPDLLEERNRLMMKALLSV